MNNASTPIVTVVGSINADLVTQVQRHPKPGETVPGTGGSHGAGGKGANQAVAARLHGEGAQVRLVGAVGTDVSADAALAGLRTVGVDLNAVREVEGPTGLALVTVAADGENTIIVVPGANGQVAAAAVAVAEDIIRGADVVVGQCEIPTEATWATAQLAQRFVFNYAPVIDIDPELLRAGNPLVVNEHEAQAALTHLGGAEISDPAELTRALLAAGVPSVVITLGADGAVIGEGDQIEAIASEKVEVVDTTGAGDAFVGALAARLAAGDDLASAARHGARAGAWTCTVAGAQPTSLLA